MPTVDLKELSDCRNKMMDQFWKIWSDEYIRNLPPWRGNATRDGLVVGSVVLIRQDGLPRMRWLVGVVIKLYPSARDGLVRTVDVKTSKGVLIRPVQLLHKLEVDSLESGTHEFGVKYVNPNSASRLDCVSASLPDVSNTADASSLCRSVDAPSMQPRSNQPSDAQHGSTTPSAQPGSIPRDVMTNTPRDVRPPLYTAHNAAASPAAQSPARISCSDPVCVSAAADPLVHEYS